MKQIGDYLYTINESSQRVRTWKIREINGDCYVCESRRTDRIREFSKDDPSIFDTEEGAMKVIKKNENEKGFNYGRIFPVYGSYYGYYSTLSDSKREFLEV